MHSSLKQKTLSSLVWKFFERAGNQIIQLVVQVVLARLLAPDAFGMLAIMTVFINVGNVIVQSGLTTALVQSPQEESHPDDFSTVFWMSVLASAVMFGIVFVPLLRSHPSTIWRLWFGLCAPYPLSLS